MKTPAILVLGGQGYIGSALVLNLRGSGFAVSIVDLSMRGTPIPLGCRHQAYQELTADELEAFGTVILLAGHSSVAACEGAPVESFHNNVSGFTDLVHKLRGQQLIFASSISVYVNTNGHRATEEEPLPAPVSYYDWHKQAIEKYAQLSYGNAFALRFGTICGPAPNIRTELLLNSMVLSALRTGRIQAANRHILRPLLGINDLCRAVEALVTRPIPPGCYNLASVNATIGDVADQVIQHFGAHCLETSCPNRYDIGVSSKKFEQAADFVFQDDVLGLAEELRTFYAVPPELRSPTHGL